MVGVDVTSNRSGSRIPSKAGAMIVLRMHGRTKLMAIDRLTADTGLCIKTKAEAIARCLSIRMAKI